MAPSRVATVVVVLAAVGGSLFARRRQAVDPRRRDRDRDRRARARRARRPHRRALARPRRVPRRGRVHRDQRRAAGVRRGRWRCSSRSRSPRPPRRSSGCRRCASAACRSRSPRSRSRSSPRCTCSPAADVTAAGRTLERPPFLRSDVRLYLFASPRSRSCSSCGIAVAVTKAGRSFLAVRDIEDRARGFGVEPGPSKLLAYAISGAIVGLAGGLLALKAGSISAKDPFLLLESLQLVAIVVVGGAGSAAGIITAAVLVKGVPQFMLDDPVHRPASRPDRPHRLGGAARGRDRRRARGHRRAVPRRRPAPRPAGRRARTRAPGAATAPRRRGAPRLPRCCPHVARPLSLRMPVPALLEADDVTVELRRRDRARPRLARSAAG